jgi:hypothetical protein
MSKNVLVLTVALLAAVPAFGEDLTYKQTFTEALVRQVPTILDTFDEKTGAFGEGVWICRDQDRMYPLAVAYAIPASGNKYYKDPKLLDVIVKAGDRLIREADKSGQWVFRKKDNSTWGNIWMPWTYSRWIRTFALIRADMPADRRKAWEQALILGYTGIAASQFAHIHNISTHHAMGLYIAGQNLNRPEWCRTAADYLHKVAAAQAPGGYWSEGGGPVVHYSEVYVEALGIYHAASGDTQVLPALAAAAAFHRAFTYPSGQSVETIDQRNPFDRGVRPGNVGFTFTPVGRAYLKQQWAALGTDNLPADLLACLIQFGQEGPTAAPPASQAAETFVLKDQGQDKAAIIRDGPWFVCLSAYTSPVAASRWHQDRQNMVSVFHDKVGLVIGGGNTKLQPAWSNFTVGDESLLRHKPGDVNPDFVPPAGKLFHVPSAAKLLGEPARGLELIYGPRTCTIRVSVLDERTLNCTLSVAGETDLPTAAHVTLLPQPGKMLVTGGGQSYELGEKPLNLSADELAGSLTHAGWRLKVPKAATLIWPALPHNPYRKDGRAEASEGRISICIPFEAGQGEQQVTLEIEP